ncbi:MAG: hypothetical protein GY926_00375, partial [bacterium]|nr:hypothetical protein [bacterium]
MTQTDTDTTAPNPMEPYQQRVVAELEELQARIDKLIAFLPSPIGVGLDAADRVLLEQQLVMMN